MDRRGFLKSAGALAALAACGESSTGPGSSSASLRSRPRLVTRSLEPGTTRRTIGTTPVVVELPESAMAKASVPVMLFLHGAGRGVETLFNAFRPLAAQHGVALVMPASVHVTWDAINGDFAHDRAGIDGVLEWLFGSITVDPSRLALAGFSDGATYALGLGRANGDLFSRTIAHSPGFLLDVPNVGRRPIVISHGTNDQVLPYDHARYSIYPALRGMGFDVDFRTFSGGHAVPLSIVTEQMALLGAASPQG